MNIVICDDERVFAEQLEWRIRRYAAKRNISIQIQKVYSGEALISMDLSGCDLLLLDIEMPKMSGMKVARVLREKYGEELLYIFVTGWLDYVMEGYRVKAFRYLLKKRLDMDLELYLDEARNELLDQLKLIDVPTKGSTLEVAVKDILYFEGTTRRRTLLHLVQRAQPIECLGRLQDYDDNLSESGFLRLQKSFLGNMRNIVLINNYKAKLKNGEQLGVSRAGYKEKCNKFLMWRNKVE